MFSRARRAFRPADPGDKNYADDRLNEAHRNETERRTAFAGPRARTVQSLSIDAARMYAEGHFDWVYLDALHTRDAVLGDLQAWWTALRPGGLLTGDDYGDIEDTEYVKGGLTQCPETAHGMLTVPLCPLTAWHTVCSL